MNNQGSAGNVKNSPGRKWASFPGHWLIGCVREFKRDALRLYQQAGKHGHYVRIRAFPGVNVYLVTEPDAVEHVLQKNHHNYRKPDFFNKSIRPLVGARKPVRTLKSVVLPAPLGPMTPRISPWRSARLYSVSASRPRKRRETFVARSSTPSATAACAGCGEPIDAVN